MQGCDATGICIKWVLAGGGVERLTREKRQVRPTRVYCLLFFFHDGNIEYHFYEWLQV